MDPISVSGAYQGTKAAKEILSALIDAKVDAKAKERILNAQHHLGEVQDLLFQLREQLSELQGERDQLQQRLAEAQAWATKAAAYELFSTTGGAVVFRFRGEPEHLACPSCFNKSEVHILQDDRVAAGTYRCTGCKSKFPVKVRQAVSVGRVERY